MCCVLCGIALQDENQEGLLCRHCKQSMNKRNREHIICVHYCFCCGKPYQPDDTSIRHSYHSYGFTEHLAITPESRKETDVILISPSQSKATIGSVEAPATRRATRSRTTNLFR